MSVGLSTGLYEHVPASCPMQNGQFELFFFLLY